jgi:hypothetical protein
VRLDLTKHNRNKKAKDWEHNSCFICHRVGYKAKECPDKPQNTTVDFAWNQVKESEALLGQMSEMTNCVKNQRVDLSPFSRFNS